MLRLRQRSRRGRIRCSETRGEGNDRAPLRAPRGALQANPQSGALRLAQDQKAILMSPDLPPRDVCGQMCLATKLGAHLVQLLLWL